jgi:D-serine deaminase-like pyridoxal phosphate-dependent protein
LLELPGVTFAGLQAYEGHLVNVLDRAERRERARAAMQQAVDTRRLIESAGIPVGCISGCSSATYDATGTLAGVDEVQAGTYATMDRQYQRLAPEFEVALSILVRVISRPAATKAVLDVGVKGAGCEFGVPGIRDFPDVEIKRFSSEEHVVVDNVPDWRIGDLVQLVPTHACTTCNLYREIVAHENGRVVDVWPIEASGKLT